MDWVGVVIERATGMSLEKYFERFIFKPMGVSNIKFFPTEEMKAALATMHQRARDGSLSTRDHLYRVPLLPRSLEDNDPFCMGGGGCFGKPAEFCSACP